MRCVLLRRSKQLSTSSGRTLAKCGYRQSQGIHYAAAPHTTDDSTHTDKPNADGKWISNKTIHVIISRTSQLRPFLWGHVFNHSAVCLPTAPQPVPKTVLHTARPSDPAFNSQHLLFSLSSSCSCLRLLSLLPVTPVLTFIFHSITCFYKAVTTQDVTNPVSLPSFFFQRINLLATDFFFFSNFSTLCI